MGRRFINARLLVLGTRKSTATVQHLWSNYLVRWIKRVGVLVPGIAVIYLSARDIFPPLDRHLPVAVALILTYALSAYVLVPALLRLIRLIFPPHHLPLYCTTPDGFASDPLNIGIIGTRDQVRQIMLEAGWHQAEPHSPLNVPRQIFSLLMNRPYPNLPMSRLYLLGRKQDMGFQLAVDNRRGYRHHVRFWAAAFNPDEPLSRRSINLRERTRQHAKSERLLWLGAATFDVGFAPIKHNLQITHMIDPDTDKERELLVAHLVSTGKVERLQRIRLTARPYRLSNRAWRGYLHSDGMMAVCELNAAGNAISGSQ